MPALQILLVLISQVSFSHLLKDFAIGLEFVLLTEHLSRAQTVSVRVSGCSKFKHFVQSVHPGVQHQHQLFFTVYGPVRAGWVSAYWAGFSASSSLQVAASPGEEVRRYIRDDSVDPDYRTDHLQQQRVDVLLQLHCGGWSKVSWTQWCTVVSSTWMMDLIWKKDLQGREKKKGKAEELLVWSKGRVSVCFIKVGSLWIWFLMLVSYVNMAARSGRWDFTYCLQESHLFIQQSYTYIEELADFIVLME